ncbi:MAG TPA: hypothetical protein VLT83_14355 [Opitutaceae bacterium]|nr:hypothetical protein [Opitutaceae bacterium]
MRNVAVRARGVVWILAAGVVLFAVGAKLALIHSYGSDQPFADQWAAEGATLFRADLYGRLGWSNFFLPHGEHHPALTRGLAYALFVANGRQWDNRVEAVANLTIYAAYLFGLWLVVVRLVAVRWQLPLAGVAALLFGLPANRENFLWGFQSVFLFLLLCGVAHVYGTLRAPRPNWGWAGAQLAGLAGLFSIASGLMSAATVGLVAGVGILRGRRDAWHWATLAVNVALVGVGLWLLSPYAGAPSEPAPSPARVLLSAGHLLSWPLPGPWSCLVIYLPWAAAVIQACREKSAGRACALLFGLGAWVALMVLAIAYGRGVGPDAIAVRYFDLLTLGLFVNGVAAVRLMAARAGWRRWAAVALAAAWAIPLGLSLYQMNRPAEVRPLLAQHREMTEKQAAAIGRLMETRDATALSADDRVRSWFPHLQLTVDLLLDPRMRPLLAPSLTADGRAGPLSRWAPKVAAGWPVLVGFGAALLAAGAVRLLASRRARTAA